MILFDTLNYYKARGPTAGVTGKRGKWRIKPPDAESAVGARIPESAAERPHLSGARGVGLCFIAHIRVKKPIKAR